MIVIEVRGGVVQEVYASPPVPRVVLVDWDNIDADGGPTVIEPADMNEIPADTAEQLAALERENRGQA